MLSEDERAPTPPPTGRWFTTTPWGIVVTAKQQNTPEAAEALQTLCTNYWYPLYAYVRRRGHDAHLARDVVQDFFCRFIEKDFLRTVNAERGKFRSFLLASMNHSLANERDRARAIKRGGQFTFVSLDDETAEERYRLEPATSLTPAMIFERRWALAVLERALGELREEFVESGRQAQFERLKEFLEGGVGRGDYETVAAALKVTSGAVAVAVQRLRRRYRDLVRLEVSRTVLDPTEVEAEMRHLF